MISPISRSLLFLALSALAPVAFGLLAESQVIPRYADLPLSFEANRGQSADDVQFLSRGAGYSLFLSPTEAVLALRAPASSDSAQPDRKDLRAQNPTDRVSPSSVVRMRWLGANAQPTVLGVDLLPGKSNYFIGDDPKRWHTAVPHYAKVKYQAVYPGIDLVYYGQQRQLEYDFIVAPGADPKQIRLAFSGVEDIRIDTRGDLILTTDMGEIIQHKPIVYQEIGGKRKTVAGDYSLYSPSTTLKRRAAAPDETQVGFALASYDTTRPLIIDPILSYSTYLGGESSDVATAIAVDVAGQAYVIGVTSSADFPTTPGAFDRNTFGSKSDMFITKLNATGTALIYSTFLGSSDNDNPPEDIAIDAEGNVYIAGFGGALDFPTTPGAFRRVPVRGEGFVTKLNAAGNALAYSTFLGGSDTELAYGIAVDATGHAYVTGITASRDFPSTPGAFDRVFKGFSMAFITKLNPTGTGLVYSTLLGGSLAQLGEGIAVDAADNAYVAGTVFSPDFPTTPGALDRTCGFTGRCNPQTDIFVTKLNAVGNALVYSTFLGGRDVENNAEIAIDPLGNAYITGSPNPDFPLVKSFQPEYAGSHEAFVAKLNASGSALIYSTFLGGIGADFSRDIAVDRLGNAYVTGDVSSPDFPTTPGAFDRRLDGPENAFISKFSPTGALAYSTFLGGRGAAGRGIAVDDLGNVYVAGGTAAADFPTTPGALDRTCGTDGKCNDPMDGETPPSADVFVTKLPTRVCLGRPITILGTNRDDVLNGTHGPDVIDGLSGNDTINGLGGDDLICGGFGNDTLAGNDGNDRLHGGRDTDRLFGNAGNDRLSGKGGDDALDGGAGIDTCNGEGLVTDPADTGVDTAVRCENVDNVP